MVRRLNGKKRTFGAFCALVDGPNVLQTLFRVVYKSMSHTNARARWTSDLIDTSIKILESHGNYTTALQEISNTLGFSVTRDSIDKAFVRYGKRSPFSYLKVVPFSANHYVGATKPFPRPEQRIQSALRLVGPPPPIEEDEDEQTIEIDLKDLDVNVTRAASTGGYDVDHPVADRTYIEKPRSENFRGDEIAHSGELEAHLYIPDCHHPFADPKAWGLLVKAAHNLRARYALLRIFILGDFADFYSVSSHDKDPRRVNQLSGELAVVNERLDEIDAVGADWKHFIEGNHEYRLARYLVKNAPALVDSFSVPELLHLADRGWSFTPYRSYLKVGKLMATHDVGVAGAYAAFRAGAAFEHSVITGHTHRVTSTYFSNAVGESHVSMTLGWLGSQEEIDYLHKIKTTRDWQHAFGVGLSMPDGCIHLHAAPIVERTCVVFGEVVT